MSKDHGNIKELLQESLDNLEQTATDYEYTINPELWKEANIIRRILATIKRDVLDKIND